MVVLIAAALGIVAIVLSAIQYDENYTRHLRASKVSVSNDESYVNLRLSSSEEELVIRNTVRFDRNVYFVNGYGLNITAVNGTFTVLLISNQTTQSFYNVDSTIELLMAQLLEIDVVFGMPNTLPQFLYDYTATTPSKKRSSYTRTPTLPAFLTDTLNNITTLQTEITCLNSSINLNANYALYNGQSNPISVSPASDTLALTTSGSFAQQVGIVLNSNTFSVGKVGQYIVSYSIGASQPATENLVQASLQVDGSSVDTVYSYWPGYSTGMSYVSSMALLTLTTSNVVKIVITSSTTGASTDAASTQLSVWNIS